MVTDCAQACGQTQADDLRLYTLLSKASIRLQADLTGVPPTEQTVVEAQQANVSLSVQTIQTLLSKASGNYRSSHPQELRAFTAGLRY